MFPCMAGSVWFTLDRSRSRSLQRARELTSFDGIEEEVRVFSTIIRAGRYCGGRRANSL